MTNSLLTPRTARHRIGCDEAGRGPLAGPVVGAAVCFRPGYRNRHIDDSKKLSYEKRDHLYDIIRNDAVAFAIIAVGARRIEQINILQASLLAMKLATLKIMARMPEDIREVLIDGNQAFCCRHSHPALKIRTIIDGDSLELCIGAASILAKVYRDRLMLKLHEKFPSYGFSQHAGYPTLQHRTAIEEIGICREHRRTFAGVRERVPHLFSAKEQISAISQ